MATTRMRRVLGNAALAAALLGLSVAQAVSALGLVPGALYPGRIFLVFGPEWHFHTSVALWWTASALGAAAIVLRCWLPVPAYAIAVVVVGWHLSDRWFPVTPIDLCASITLYSAALAGPGNRRTYTLFAAGLVGGVGFALTGQHLLIPAWEIAPPSQYAPLWYSDVMLPLVGLVPPVLAVGARRRELVLLEQRARDRERDREQRATLDAIAERARLSRELHDIIGHSLSVMVIQTQAAMGVLDSDRVAAGHALDQVVAVGQRSLTEMRHLLDLLRPAIGPADALSPPVRLVLLPELLGRLGHAGLATTLDAEADLTGIPTVVDASAYRIVQEALTNTLKHAGPHAAATVRLTRRAGTLDIEVTDDGTGPPAGPPGCGNGLRGMRERAAALGGAVEAGPAPSGGFRVHATLPLGPRP